MVRAGQHRHDHVDPAVAGDRALDVGDGPIGDLVDDGWRRQRPELLDLVGSHADGQRGTQC
jgi:hypothetical protein